MTLYTVGSLCTGYGGLDIAVESMFGARTIWYSEIDKHPSTLLSSRLPGVPNLGDLKKILWSEVDHPDILTAGYPCQPFSQAGLRKGAEDERHLWPYIREAIRELRPRYAIMENVAGHRSKGFYEVLADCAEDGLSVRWASVRASDAGAPHRRDRLYFVISTDTSFERSQGEILRFGGPLEVAERCGEAIADAPDDRLERSGEARHRRVRPPYRDVSATYSLRSTVREQPGRTPPEKARKDTGHGPEDHRGARTAPLGREGHNTDIDWGPYEPAIRRWESALGRPAPDPTEPNKNGRPRLTVAFDEWMMGLPEGWINDIDIPYGAKIKLCGNGVVPQQAYLALSQLFDWTLYRSDFELVG